MAHKIDKLDRDLRAIKLRLGREMARAEREGRIDEYLRDMNRRAATSFPMLKLLLPPRRNGSATASASSRNDRRPAARKCR